MASELGEAAWTGFVKKHKLELDDAALRKALARFDKTDESKPQPRLEALKEVAEQVNKQVTALARRKKELGDKPFTLVKDQLHALLEQAETLQKKTQAAVDAHDDDEEPDTPVLLTTKMVPLLRELRKGQVQMHAMICTAGKNTAVLIMRKPIGPSRRKLLADAVDAKGGMKYITGECVFEDKALTFIVKSPAAQLAKRLRQALLDQTDLRFKVRVRGEDGVDEDGETEGDETAAATQAPGTQSPRQPASAEQIAYTQRLRKVRERYEQALREQHAESTKLRALMGFASEKADAQHDYAAATKALETLDKLLEAPSRGAGGPDGDAAAFNARLAALLPKAKEAGAAAKLKASEAGALARQKDFARANALLDEVEQALAGGTAAAGVAPAKEAPARAGGFVDYAKARLAWLDARKSVEADLGKLKKAILAAYSDSPHMNEVQSATRRLDVILRSLDEALADKLDEGLNASDPQRRTAINRQASDIIARYQGFINASPLVREVDDNPFVPVNVRKLLVSTLDSLERQLA